MRERMLELKLYQRDLAERSRMSMATWTQLLNGPREAFEARTLRRASEALGWSEDSIARLLSGREPVPAGRAADLVADLERLRVEDAATYALLEQMVRNAINKLDRG